MAENKPVIPLKRSSEFLLLNQKGKKIRASGWLTIITLDSDDTKNYFGTTVSKKVGVAVLRNKLKRWVRNCVQSESWPTTFQGKRVVFVFRAQPEGFYRKLVYSEFKKIFSSI